MKQVSFHARALADSIAAARANRTILTNLLGSYGGFATDPELKGRWTEPPAAKRRFSGELE